MNFKRYALLALAFSALIIPFQNCSGTSPEVLFSGASTDKPSADSGSTDNGHPYDGKIYLLTGDLCPDGTRLQARIVLKSSVSADLVREKCQEITPVALAANEFRLDPNDSRLLEYKNQTFVNQLIGIKLDLSKVAHEAGFSYWTTNSYDFGNVATDGLTDKTASRLRLYEDGMPLGPAHSEHVDIRTLGEGRFSHWTTNMLRFSASDNSDPLTNGRTYTWEIQ